MDDTSTSVASIMNGTGTCTTLTGEPAAEDTLRILIASDNHLGFADTNPGRESDSFVTFEEILQLAKEQNADFLLLGGDLFHENKPKPATFQRTIDLLQRHVLGDRPVQFEYMGDPAIDFRSTSAKPEVNYMNPNINIGLPIFTIHGNHDDPIGGHRTSVVDHLAAASLVNHFGQWSVMEGIDIAPVCIRKGETQLALYGMGHLKDERLFRLLRDNKVKFLCPDEDRDAWFSIFVLHQNRTKHGPKNYFPEMALPGFLDYVVWGHEHECRGEDENIYAGDETHMQYILQPGSSVATSLCEGEAKEKNVYMLEVNRRQFRCQALRLKTVRPFEWQSMRMADILEGYKGSNSGSGGSGRGGAQTEAKKKAQLQDASKYVEAYVRKEIENMLDRAARQLTNHPKQPTLPLLRLRLEYDDEEQQFNTIRIMQEFKEQVANDDIITFKKSGRGTIKTEDDAAEMSVGAIRQMINQLDDQNLGDLGAHVEEIVEQHFTKEKEKGEGMGQVLEVLSDKGLSEAIRACVDKDDKESIGLIVDAQMQATIDYLMTRTLTEENVDEEVKKFRDARAAAGGDVEQVQAADKSAKLLIRPAVFAMRIRVRAPYALPRHAAVQWPEPESDPIPQPAPDDPEIVIDQYEVEQILEEVAAQPHGDFCYPPGTSVEPQSLQTVCIIDPDTGEPVEHQIEVYEEGSSILPEYYTMQLEGEENPPEGALDGDYDTVSFVESEPAAPADSPPPPKDKPYIEPLPFGFQGQRLSLQAKKLVLNVWHFFKLLKKRPQLLEEKHAQGLAAQALNIGRKSIGHVGQRYRAGRIGHLPVKPQQIIEENARSLLATRKNRRTTQRKAVMEDSSDEEPQIDDDDEEMNGDSDSEAMPPPAAPPAAVRGRGRGGRARGATAAGNTSRGGRGSRGGASAAAAGRGRGRGAAAAVQQRLPFRQVPVETRRTGGAGGVSAVQFDDDSD